MDRVPFKRARREAAAAFGQNQQRGNDAIAPSGGAEAASARHRHCVVADHSCHTGGTGTSCSGTTETPMFHTHTSSRCSSHLSSEYVHVQAQAQARVLLGEGEYDEETTSLIRWRIECPDVAVWVRVACHPPFAPHRGVIPPPSLCACAAAQLRGCAAARLHGCGCVGMWICGCVDAGA